MRVPGDSGGCQGVPGREPRETWKGTLTVPGDSWESAIRVPGGSWEGAKWFPGGAR